MVKTLHFQCRWCRFNPWSGNQAPISHMEWPKKKKKKQSVIHTALARNPGSGDSEQLDGNT